MQNKRNSKSKRDLVLKTGLKKSTDVRTILRHKGETLEDLARRAYCVSDQYGHESPSRLEKALAAIRATNRNARPKKKFMLPHIEHIPFLRAVVKDQKALQEVVRLQLGEVESDPKLLALSFIDPLRLGVEELGISWTPEMSARIHARLQGLISFNQHRYEEIRDNGGRLRGINSIHWNVELDQGEKKP